MPDLYEANEEFLKIIAEKVRGLHEFRENIGGSMLTPTLQEEFNFWKNYNADSTKKIIVAVGSERVIGFYALDEINHGAKNARAHVHMWQQSKDLYTLCQMFLDLCRIEYGLSKLWGMTNSTNKTAWNFAQKIGFVEVGRLPKHYSTSKGCGDAIISSLDLMETKK